jgi:hypothetical protein
VLLARAAAAAKAAGALLALTLLRPWRAGHPAGLPRAAPAAASVPPIAYGRLNVLAAAPCPVRYSPPPRNGDRTALRWHAGVWDFWFFVWGILLALGTAGTDGGQRPQGAPAPPNATHNHPAHPAASASQALT